MKWYVPWPTSFPRGPACTSPCGLVQPNMDPKLLCGLMCRQLCPVFVNIHVLTCEWLAMCLVAPHFVCLLVCTHLGSRCRGRGVLAHTSKQHHELLLPAYLKIETAEETRPHRALGEGWVEGGRGMAQSPCPALSLSLHLPLAQRSFQGYLWGPDAWHGA